MRVRARHATPSSTGTHLLLGNQGMEKLQATAPQGNTVSFHEFRSEVFRILMEEFQWHGGGNIRLFEKQEEMVRKAFYNGDKPTGTAQAVFDNTIRPLSRKS